MNNNYAFSELMEEFSEMISKVENVTEILTVGASEFVDDLLKLPKPMSKIKAPGYTHLVDSFNYKVNKNEVEVGWGKYYGRMVEEGTKRSRSNPHLIPTFEKNKEKYYQHMMEKFM